VERIDYFGILGYGVDIINNNPKEQLINYTFDKKQTFNYNSKILIPDQFIFDPTPIGAMTKGYFSQVMKNSREQQRALAGTVGINEMEIKGLEFSSEAGVSNKKYEMTDNNTVKQFVDNLAYYTVMQIKGIDFKDNLTSYVRDAISACQDEQSVHEFFDIYGTYVVNGAQVGGQIHIQTSLSISSETAKKIAEGSVDISAEAEKEDEQYAKGDLSFTLRDMANNALFRENSRVEISLIGGDITANDSSFWRESLKESLIPTQSIPRISVNRVNGPHFAAYFSDSPNQYLGLINLNYIPIYEVLGLSKDQKDLFKSSFESYLSGVNPFNNDVKRYKPTDISLDHPLKKGEKNVWEMKGWMATYESWAGLEGKPGASAIVKCISDAEPGGKTEKKIYAGETIQLRKKTPYLSAKMYFWFDSVSGDDNAIVYTENKLVSW